jgi:hypothetical protein
MNINKLRKLAAQLINLQEFSRNGDPEQAPPVLASVLDLIIFLTLHQLAFPSVVLTPAGHVRAHWRCGRGEHFALAFLGDNMVQYVIFAPDQENAGNTLTVSGTATVDSIMQIAEPYGVPRWASAPDNQTTGENNDACTRHPHL